MKIYYYLYGAYVSGVTVIPEAPNDLRSHSARWLKKKYKNFNLRHFLRKIMPIWQNDTNSQIGNQTIDSRT